MTMHLLPCYYTTTSTRKRKSKPSKSQAAHEAWVKSMTGGKKATEPNKYFWQEYAESMRVDRSAMNKTGIVSGSTPKPDTKVYSGEMKLLGIATMHKSNMVPVFAKTDAEDIARMRRG